MANSMKGIIALWSGAIADIPFGWKLCDGNNGTPDLRDKFVQGAGGALIPDEFDDTPSHGHPVNQGTHNHDIPVGINIAAGTDYAHTTSTTLISGQTDLRISKPPWYALAYIMHI